MTTRLPDVASTDSPAHALPLDWVGMDGIDLPLRVGDVCVPASVDVAVDLPRGEVKGIHMSRLHRLLNEVVAHQPLTYARLAALLRQMVESHADCGSRAARAVWRFKLLRARPALVTPDLSAWQAYPVTVFAEWRDGIVLMRLTVDVTYSSTCPCSAALSRQVLQDTFLRAFAKREHVSPQAVADWLDKHGSVATPHSQRSVAQVTVDVFDDSVAPPVKGVSARVFPLTPAIVLPASAMTFTPVDKIKVADTSTDDSLGVDLLIARVEAALGTAVQTAVKRVDEQAFAQRNGQNLMYVEDAARRIRASLAGNYQQVQVAVRHLESLHPHDAVASAGGRRHGSAM